MKLILRENLITGDAVGIKVLGEFHFIVVTKLIVFLLCDFIGSSPPGNHMKDQRSIRVDEHYTVCAISLAPVQLVHVH